MDPTANLAEQLTTARDILEAVDACSDDGEFTPEQLDSIVVDAARLADLVTSLADWNAKCTRIVHD